MSDDYPLTKRNRVRQIAEKGVYDRPSVHAILDAGIVAHVAFVEGDVPVVVPMLYARDNETIFLHGARKARIIRMLERNAAVTLNVTLLDALVLARSAFNSSMNYRSVTVFGRPSLVDDREHKLGAMRAISEHLMPGRWDELRAPLENEIKMTGVIAVAIESASAKVSAKPTPDDEEDDYALPVWAGLLPIESRFQTLVDADRLLPGATPSDAVRVLQGKKL